MGKKHLFLLIAIWAAASWGVIAQEHRALPADYSTGRAYVKEAVLAERDFPLLSVLMQDTSIRELLAHDAKLRPVTDERWKAVALANRTCDRNVTCKSQSLEFTPEQIADVSTALRRLYESNPLIRNFLHKKMKPTALFSLDPLQLEEAVFIAAWVRDANQMNQIIATYCNGNAARYPDIDSMIYSGTLKTYASLITILLDDLPIEESATATSRSPEESLFFEPTLRFSLRLLQSNSHDEAGRLWPLQTGENAAAIRRMRSIQWSRFHYSVIVVPGAGSELANVSISPWGRERVRLGVYAFRSGQAPFILVSGGFVHPSLTPYCEAVEMKRYLMEVYGVPERAILIDPHARHTTTNLRNASREVFEYGMPSAKPMLVVSDTAQISYIQSAAFLDRNRQELGYLPVTLGNRLSPTQMEAVPSVKSLYVDATDPLDP